MELVVNVAIICVLLILFATWSAVKYFFRSPNEHRGAKYFSSPSTHHEPATYRFLRQEDDGFSIYMAEPGMNLRVTVRQQLDQMNVQVFGKENRLHLIVLAFQYNFRTDKLVITKVTDHFRPHAKWLASNVVRDFEAQRICPIHQQSDAPLVVANGEGYAHTLSEPTFTVQSDHPNIISLMEASRSLLTELSACKGQLSIEGQHQLERTGKDLQQLTTHFNHVRPSHRERMEPTFLAALEKLHQDLLDLDEQLYAANQQQMDYLLEVVQNR